MATYILLCSWTDQGIRSVKDSPKRLDAGRAAAKKLGCKIKDMYMTIGAHDLVLLVEAPDDETVARLVLTTAAGGNIRTTTMKAFSEADYRKLIGEL